MEGISSDIRFASSHPKRIWGGAVKGLAILCLSWLISTAASAQSVVLNLKRTEQALDSANLSGSLIINGPTIRGLDSAPLDRADTRDSFDHLALNLIILRLADQGLLKLDDMIGHILRSDYSTPPWRRALRVFNLMNASGGFAYVPPKYIETITKDHLPALWLEARAAGDMVAYEPASFYLLQRVAEAASDKSLNVLIREHLITPLGLDTSDIRLADSFIPNLQFSNAALAKLAQLLLRNRDKDYGTFLKPKAHDILTKGPVWAFLPTGPRRILGLAEVSMGGVRALISPHNPSALAGEPRITGSKLIALPAQNIAFVLPNNSEPSALLPVLAPVLANMSPQANGTNIEASWVEELNNLPEVAPQTQARFIRDVVPLVTLKDRLPLTLNPLVLTPLAKGQIELQTHSRKIRFSRTAPFSYTSADGRILKLSPDNKFQHIILDGVAYKAEKWAAEPWATPAYAGLASLALLTLLIYWRSELDPRYRRMAQLAPLGLMLTWAGTGLDLWLYDTFIFHLHWPWLVIGWRLVMLAGLAMIAALPAYTIMLARESELLPLRVRFAVQMHFLLILLSSVLFIGIHIAWGLAPDIIPVW